MSIKTRLLRSYVRPEYFYIPVDNKKSYTLTIEQRIPTIYDIATQKFTNDYEETDWCTYRILDEDGKILYNRITGQSRSYKLFEGKYTVQIIYTRYYNPLNTDFQTTFEIDLNDNLDFVLLCKPDVLLVKNSVGESDIGSYMIPSRILSYSLDYFYYRTANVDFDNTTYYKKTEYLYVKENKIIAEEYDYSALTLSGVWYQTIRNPHYEQGNYIIFASTNGSKKIQFDLISDYELVKSIIAEITLLSKPYVNYINIVYESSSTTLDNVPFDEISDIIEQYSKDDNVISIRFGATFYFLHSCATQDNTKNEYDVSLSVPTSQITTAYSRMRSVNNWQNIEYDPERYDMVYDLYNSRCFVLNKQINNIDEEQDVVYHDVTPGPYGTDGRIDYEEKHDVIRYLTTPGRFYMDPTIDSYIRSSSSSYFGSKSFSIKNSEIDTHNKMSAVYQYPFGDSVYQACCFLMDWYAEDY